MPKRKQFNDAPSPEEPSEIRAESAGEGKRKPLTVTIPEKLAERARDAAYHDGGTTVSGLVEEGLRRVLNEMGDIPPRPDGEQLPSGPPPSE
jgi:hypothetical protein